VFWYSFARLRADWRKRGTSSIAGLTMHYAPSQSTFALVSALRPTLVAVSLIVHCLLPALGCRALRSRKTSDEGIAAARKLSLQGIDAQQRGQWDRAEMLFAAAILKCPSDERARCGYAESLWQRGQCDMAISHMEEAARLSGHDPERLVRLGQMYLERGSFVGAERQADVAIAANPQLAAAWALRGQVLQAKGNRTDALASFHRALSYQSSYPEVQLAIADIYAAENRPERALATLQSLESSFPRGQAPSSVLVGEALALRALSRHRDAARLLADAVRQTNPSADLLYELARTQALAGETGSARQTAIAALEREPQHVACAALMQELGPQPAVTTASAVGVVRPQGLGR
jgi:tetratricopeptide (TPR) repeat protein